MFPQYHNNFDLIRLLAATQVMVWHASRHLDIDLGAFSFVLQVFPGVPIFFVISGMLVYGSYERTKDLRTYYRNRFLRIYPGLWVCLALSILSAWLVGGVSFLVPEAVPWLVAQATIAQFYNPDFLRDFGVGVLNGSLWTISIELQFYILLPALCALLASRQKKSNQILLLLCGVSLVANLVLAEVLDAFSWSVTKFIAVTIFPYLFYFLIGIAAYRHLELIKPMVVGKFHLWFAAYAATATLTWMIGWHPGGNTINPVSALVLSGLILSAAFTRVELSTRLLRGNDISYGVYIFHVPVLNVLVHEQFPSTYASLFVAVFVSYLAGLLSWVLVERRFIHLKRLQVVCPDGSSSALRV